MYHFLSNFLLAFVCHCHCHRRHQQWHRHHQIYQIYHQKICYWWCSDITFFCSQHIIQLLSTHISLQWRHKGNDSVSNHQPHDCLLKRLFRCRSKKTSKLRVTGLCAGKSSVNSPHKWPVPRKMFPFDDVIMCDLSALYFQKNCCNFITWYIRNYKRKYILPPL